MANVSHCLVLLFHFILVLGSKCSWACKVTAQTQAGPVCGTVIQNRLASFKGVPYANQPVGELRFQELQSVKPWNGILDATKEGPVCPQLDRLYTSVLLNTSNQDEACIFANIHTPVAAVPPCDSHDKPAAKLPVLVFAHGGAFQAGAGSSDFFGPEYFVDKNVVLVTFNFRQNVFGYMSLNTTKVPGNQGLRDVLHLLRWVQDNIHFFGGDPENVTLMGQSSGAAAAHLVALSPLSKGLFKRLVLSSGTALSSFYTTTPAYSQLVSNMLLTKLGIGTNDPEAAFKQLIALPVSTILNAYDVIQNTTGIVAFAPVVESHLDHVTPIISQDPGLLLEKGGLNDMPLLIGFNTAECRIFQNRINDLKFIDALKANPTLLLSYKLLYSSSNETAAMKAEEVKKRYFKGEIDYDGFINVCSDTYFVYPVLKIAQLRADSGSDNTFLYQFSYEGQFRSPLVAQNVSKFDGVAHIEDLTYVFRVNSVLNKLPSLVTPIDDQMRTSWIDTIISFMKCSRPDCNKKGSRTWPAVQANKLAYQDIQRPGVFVNTPITEERRQMVEFFDKIGTLL